MSGLQKYRVSLASAASQPPLPKAGGLELIVKKGGFPKHAQGPGQGYDKRQNPGLQR